MSGRPAAQPLARQGCVASEIGGALGSTAGAETPQLIFRPSSTFAQKVSTGAQRPRRAWGPEKEEGGMAGGSEILWEGGQGRGPGVWTGQKPACVAGSGGTPGTWSCLGHSGSAQDGRATQAASAASRSAPGSRTNTSAASHLSQVTDGLRPPWAPPSFPAAPPPGHRSPWGQSEVPAMGRGLRSPPPPLFSLLGSQPGLLWGGCWQLAVESDPFPPNPFSLMGSQAGAGLARAGGGCL